MPMASAIALCFPNQVTTPSMADINFSSQGISTKPMFLARSSDCALTASIFPAKVSAEAAACPPMAADKPAMIFVPADDSSLTFV